MDAASNSWKSRKFRTFFAQKLDNRISFNWLMSSVYCGFLAITSMPELISSHSKYINYPRKIQVARTNWNLMNMNAITQTTRCIEFYSSFKATDDIYCKTKKHTQLNRISFSCLRINNEDVELIESVAYRFIMR